ncbi:LamG-like jellyroll fold domain-containing protein [Sorangium sp. So ce119]|uniref:LamG-like jellyroll fold domain-containing protein n=1 Tax=Sorangium sp. So ce119 TaxID=3133279 RepID=UPI003F621AB1
MAVAQWNDKSGKGVIPSIAQEVASRRPAHAPLAPNAAGLVFAAGSGQRLYTSGLNIPQPYSIFAVAKCSSQASVRAIIGSNTSGACAVLYANTASTMAVTLGGGQIAGTVDATALHAYLLIANGASSSLWVDGVQVATGTLGTNAMTELYVGASIAPSGGFWDQYIDEVMVFAGAVSADEMLSLFARSRVRWNSP